MAFSYSRRYPAPTLWHQKQSGISTLFTAANKADTKTRSLALVCSMTRDALRVRNFGLDISCGCKLLQATRGFCQNPDNKKPSMLANYFDKRRKRFTTNKVRRDFGNYHTHVCTQPVVQPAPCSEVSSHIMETSKKRMPFANPATQSSELCLLTTHLQIQKKTCP